MKKRDRYLTGVLLILIGIFVGTILTIYQQGSWVNDQSDVKMTEIKKSDRSVYDDAELEELDARFLFKSVAERTTPTVVYIETTVSVDGNEENDFWNRFDSRRARTVGSGVIITEDGYILTNNHVVEGAVNNGIQVVLNDKRVYDARLVGSDPTTDLAVLKIDARNLPAIVVGNSDNIDVGEWVLAVGNPFRLRSTVTAGIVSALSRDVQIIDVSNQLRIESFIQTDAAINRGNSGGALVNTSGELIGINTAIASQTGNYQGYGFAVPSNLASKVARDLIEYGEVQRALLGVTIQSVNAYRAEELGMESIQGVEIMTISPNGAAEEEGLRPNDVILSVDGSPVNESNELQEKIAVLRPGESVNLKIWRKGNILTKEILLGAAESLNQNFSSNNNFAPDDGDAPTKSNNRRADYERFDIGFSVMQIAKENGEESNIVVTRVAEGSEAQKRGLKEGYVITKVNDLKVEDIQSLKDLMSASLNKSQSVLLQVKTEEGATGYYELKQ
ncbi:MAG: trypsin-like peptidase domain-containing protein [Balneolaceae bacterium]|nr:trypsin-like peptidase domain-containing protein [Balneolaceae bacterium]